MHFVWDCSSFEIMSLYRNAIWFLNGIQQYTRSVGYHFSVDLLCVGMLSKDAW